MDREIIIDILNNALQNASRYAESKVLFKIKTLNDNRISFIVENDGDGFPSDIDFRKNGAGLFIAEKLAELHHRNNKDGELFLFNGGELGGAVFELILP